ncbi:hypothetical protein BpHYR1_009224 [Brachionus plicatilis]|uniref:Uncharacterized protein n=1 Tax=Brachionus plicatilis TaxID=10195 RepID=A0A3M7Q6T2_BRAPC|nr:hypothetical protein BpHYR1_009224 [Brachionus plicatilis]
MDSSWLNFSIISFKYSTNKLILSESALEDIYLFQLDQISFQRNKIPPKKNEIQDFKGLNLTYTSCKQLGIA